MEKHTQLVAQIASSVKNFYDKKQKFRIYRGATNSSRNQTLRDKKNVVDTSGLNHVLQVDTEKMLAYVEANVPMDKLVEATLAYDLTPAVVADFPGELLDSSFYLQAIDKVQVSLSEAAIRALLARALLTSMASSIRLSSQWKWF